MTETSWASIGRPSRLALLAVAIASAAAWLPTPHLLRAQDSAAPRFEDVAEAAGLRFTHDNGARGDYWLPEIMGAGAAVLADRENPAGGEILQHHAGAAAAAIVLIMLDDATEPNLALPEAGGDLRHQLVDGEAGSVDDRGKRSGHVDLVISRNPAFGQWAFAASASICAAEMPRHCCTAPTVGRGDKR